MMRFKVELKSVSDLVTDYPHSPQDQQQSITDYLEAQLADGWEFAGVVSSDSNWRWIFRAHGRAT